MRVHRHPGNIRRMLSSRLKRMAATKPLLAASLASVRRVGVNVKRRGPLFQQALHVL